MALTIYAAIAGFWGGFPLSAAKLVAYLAAYFVLYLAFCSAWTEGWLDIGVMRLVSWFVVGLAILQTYGLGNGWGGPELRFTSFILRRNTSPHSSSPSWPFSCSRAAAVFFTMRLVV